MNVGGKFQVNYVPFLFVTLFERLFEARIISARVFIRRCGSGVISARLIA